MKKTLLSAIFFSICTGTISNSAELAFNNYWLPPTGSATKDCKAGNLFDLDYQVSRTARRTKNRDGILFAQTFGRNLAKSLAQYKSEESKDFLLNAAEKMYYSQPDFSRGWSPVYVQSNLIRMTAFWLTHLKSNNQISDKEEAIVSKWIEKMLPFQMGKKGNGSRDSRAASGVALISWGSYKRDRKLVERGRQQWQEAVPWIMKSVNNLGRHGNHAGISLAQLSLEDEFNLTLGHVVEGYVLLENLGYDLSKIDMETPITWWLKVARDLHVAGQFKGYGRGPSHNWHMGWLPIYLYNPRPLATEKLITDVIKDLTMDQKVRPLFKGVSSGGRTACLWAYDY